MPKTALTIFIYTLQFAFTAVAVPIGIAASYLLPQRPFLRIVQLWAQGLFLLMGKRIERTGVPPRERNGLLILVNHSSLYDIPAVMTIWPGVAWLGRDYLLRIPLFGRMLKRLNYIGVERDPTQSARRILNQALAGAAKFNIAVFPEGTRTLSGRLGEFKRGFVHIMRSGKLDVLPVTLTGFYQLKPKNRSTIDIRAPLRMIVGKPISYEELEWLSTQDILNRMREIIEMQLRAGRPYQEISAPSNVIER